MDDKALNIRITVGTIIKAIIIFVIALAVYKLRDLVFVLLTAIVIASVIEPGTKWFVRHKIPRLLAAILMYLLVATILIGIFSFVLPPLFTETISALDGVPKYIKTIDILSPLNRSGINGVEALFPSLPNTISIGDVVSTVANAVSGFSGGIFDSINNFFGGIIDVILVLVISFYLSVREDGVGEFLAIITPIEYETYIRGLWRRSEDKIGKWMQGQILLALVVGIMVYFSMLIVGIKHPLLLAALSAVFELIPVVGMTISAIPAFFLAFLDGGIGLGLIVIGIYIFIQQIEAHIIYPIVVKKIIGVPPLLVIIALVAGAELAGFVGAILAVPLSVALMELLDDVDKRKHNR
jgi:predicted PurR-regulated permease PerM